LGSTVVYVAADWWLSTVRPAPLWLFGEFGALYTYSDLLTYRSLKVTENGTIRKLGYSFLFSIHIPW